MTELCLGECNEENSPKERRIPYDPNKIKECECWQQREAVLSLHPSLHIINLPWRFLDLLFLLWNKVVNTLFFWLITISDSVITERHDAKMADCGAVRPCRRLHENDNTCRKTSSNFGRCYSNHESPKKI